jgi:hypothetical protein
MICLLALLAFGILSIFSLKYRAYFLEALDCVTRKLTLRKCTTSFDKKMQAKVVAKTSSINPKLGGFVHKNFELLSWIVTIITIISILWTAYAGFFGVYNWYVYGNCNGPNSIEPCVFNAITGTPTSPTCGLTNCTADCNCPVNDCNCIANECSGGTLAR